MSMKIAYSANGTLVITCDGQQVEVPLASPAALSNDPPGQGLTPQPIPQQPPSGIPPRPIETAPEPGKQPRQSKPRPKFGPGVMIIRPTELDPATAGIDLFAQADRVEHLHTNLQTLRSQHPYSVIDDLRSKLDQRERAPVFSILHVDVTPDDLSDGIAVGKFKSILDEGVSGIGEIRLQLETKEQS